MAGGDAGLDLGASSQSSPTTAHEARCGAQPKSIGSFAEDLARARVSWLISPEARGTSHLNCRGAKRGRHARATETFPNEREAKKFARAKLAETQHVSAGTLNPHLPKRTIASAQMLEWLEESDKDNLA